MGRPERCDICGKGLERPDGAVGVLRCGSCHADQLHQVEVACYRRGWAFRRMTKAGRVFVKVNTPVGSVQLVDMDDLRFLLADVDREGAASA